MNTEDKWQNAREQAQAQFESIREMVEALEAAEKSDPGADAGENGEEARERILEDALSVEVRSDWYAPGAPRRREVLVHRGGTSYGMEPVGVDACAPVEYRILLCTGGPAVQIVGKLSEHGEPETACLQIQDWFLPWTDYRPLAPKDANGEVNCVGDAEEILLAYARQFYFGE